MQKRWGRLFAIILFMGLLGWSAACSDDSTDDSGSHEQPDGDIHDHGDACQTDDICSNPHPSEPDVSDVQDTPDTPDIPDIQEDADIKNGDDIIEEMDACGVYQPCQPDASAECRIDTDCPETAAFSCIDGECVDACDGVSCGADEFCFNGECHEACENNNECLGLRAYFSCVDGVCESPCEGVECGAESSCYRGECYENCDPYGWEDECPEDTHCIDNPDICVPTSCAEVNCGMNESCYEGRCIGG